MTKLSVKRSFSQFFIAIVSGIVLIFIGLYVSGLWKKWFRHDEPQTIIRTDNGTDTVKIIEKEPIRPTNPGPILPKEKEISSSPIKKQEKPEPVDVINKSINADFAILAITDGKKDNQLASVFVDWLKNYGSSSSSVLLNSFIEQGYFNQVIEGNSSAILNTNINKASPYICLVRSTINYSNSTFEGLTLANATYDIMLIETKNGKIIESTFNHPQSSSDINDKKAKQRTERFLADYLSKRKLSL